ncbi:MAG TPA: TAXI family TRAP transporter solute-binding subunit [Burkholderiaceae bacterium]|nr:TAXI family TRAP transporter solute-binding subunit [Burkholderiaceae bacterium]
MSKNGRLVGEVLPEMKSNNIKYDVFISHASEDKDEVVRPLFERLCRRGLKVWLDERELRVGDSLRRRIDHGLACSRYGVVILSPNFFPKEWPWKELNGLVAREDGSGTIILPVWHNVTHAVVQKYSPILADRIAVYTSKGLDFVADELMKVIGQEADSSSDALHEASPSSIPPHPSPEGPVVDPPLRRLEKPFWLFATVVPILAALLIWKYFPPMTHAVGPAPPVRTQRLDQEKCEEAIRGNTPGHKEDGPMSTHVGIAAGPLGGRYWQAGKRIAEIGKYHKAQDASGMNAPIFYARATKGAVDNIELVTSPENAALGLVQYDVLLWLTESSIQSHKDVVNKLRWVRPLYLEEVHVLARRDIKGVENLNGKRIALGSGGQGSRMTATRILDQLQIQFVPLEFDSPEKQICAVIAGKADAMFYVGGKPVPYFQNMQELDPDALQAVHLLPLDPNKLGSYLSVSISESDYRWLDAPPVTTVATPAVLITYAFSDSHRCRQLRYLCRRRVYCRTPACGQIDLLPARFLVSA